MSLILIQANEIFIYSTGRGERASYSGDNYGEDAIAAWP
jgi:hypothetical protein